MEDETAQHSISRDLARIFDTRYPARVATATSMKKLSFGVYMSTASHSIR
jgi:hypothetical protein